MISFLGPPAACHDRSTTATERQVLAVAGAALDEKLYTKSESSCGVVASNHWKVLIVIIRANSNVDRCSASRAGAGSLNCLGLTCLDVYVPCMMIGCGLVARASWMDGMEDPAATCTLGRILKGRRCGLMHRGNTMF